MLKRECLVLEFKPGDWYLVLERTHAPRDSFSWVDFADGYGPFISEHPAKVFLARFIDPGDAEVIRFPLPPVIISSGLLSVIDCAVKV